MFFVRCQTPSGLTHTNLSAPCLQISFCSFCYFPYLPSFASKIVLGSCTSIECQAPFSRTNPESSHLCKARLVSSVLTIMNRSTCIHIRQFFIEYPIQTPFKTNHTLRCFQMPVYRHTRPRLQGIQHPLARILCSSP